ncbi:DUF4129 domain-containing protein [Thermococcus sp. M36]|uniref:DUF4129 domain-containing protein n=1 Tax=Thermococcus sp. M36 TaxID=1638261 RepID=UPI0014387E88|nr:DUF4129 domain-containing protein [Thermococcus sp. M36]NJE04985.1 DUF4129 domain-containing protein [Thermococcus sp. M36]
MRREHLTVLLLFVVFLSTLTLGYGFVSCTSETVKSPLSYLTSSGSAGDSGGPGGSFGASVNLGDLGSSGSSDSHVPPDSDFQFKPTDIHVDCPVAVLPDDPELVCIDSPAVSLPLLPDRTYSDWDMIVWYSGIYYLPKVTLDRDVTVLRGVHIEAPINMDPPLVFASPGENLTMRIRAFGSVEDLSVHFAFSGHLSVLERDGNTTILEYRALLPENRPTGYYPFFVTGRYKNKTYAMLSWVAILRRPVVEITDYPSELFGNGPRSVDISGRVYFPDGTPVPGGRIWITLNQSKGMQGFRIGTGAVENGTFTVHAIVDESIPPGNYHLIAYYRGYMAAPSDSDPIVSIRREPLVGVEVRNDTLIIRLHWQGTPLANRQLWVEAGGETLTVRTDESGRAYIPLNLSGLNKVRVFYPGDDRYLPLNRTLSLESMNREGDGDKRSVPNKFLDYLSYLRLPILLLAVSSAAITLGRNLKRSKIKLPQVVQNDAHGRKVKFVEPLRRVFLPGEKIKVVLSGEAPLLIDGELLGEGRVFEIAPAPGHHVLSSTGDEIEIHVLPPREAILALYELHFLPLVRSHGVFDGPLTPYEILRSLSARGLDQKALSTIARVFVRAKYSGLPVDEGDFQLLLRTMEELGVLG